ncbi:hypothetical protein M0R45_038396 [Rubus argutus]|uniref:SAM domain-containing protein n=1 Tax=Rubus argutus TaxID=59490 RepID=A0AAW1W2X8_RUBAR
MEQGKGGAMVAMLPQQNQNQNQNPIEQLQARFKELEIGFRGWLSKQSLPVEAAIAGLNPQAMASFKQAQALSGGPWIQARNFAVMTGANAGISCIMKRLRGKEDVESSMVAAFGSGALFSLVSGFGGPNQAQNALTSGLFFALVQGGLFKLGQKFSKVPSADKDIYYSKTRSMLSNLGLDHYEKNFKKGLLTDYTLPLLNDSALKEVRIPPGPRLLILDHIQRDPEFQEKRKH